MTQNVVPTRLPTDEPGVIRLAWPKAPGEPTREAIAGTPILDATLLLAMFLHPLGLAAFEFRKQPQKRVVLLRCMATITPISFGIVTGGDAHGLA